jgi:site-specific DNA-methyltransferase (adenine-specific)
MAVMARYPDKYFDLAVVDPPYGINAASKIGGIGGVNKNGNAKWKNQKLNNYLAKDWDSEPPKIEYFYELFRVSKNQIVWGANHFISRMPYDSASWIVWDKKTSGNFSDCELAWSSIGGSVRKFEWLWNGFQKQRPEERIHPTQKPVALYDWILQNYATEGQNILDTHVGSGSSRIAAYKGGFNFTGFEIDPEYHALQEARFREFVMNTAPADLEPVTRHGQIKLF